YSITIGGARRTTRKVVTFIRSKDEQSIVARNPIGRQTGEELIKGIVIRFERRDIARRPGTVRRTARMVIMRIGNVSVGDRDAVLLHGGHIGKRHCRRHSVKARKPDVSLWVLNHVTVQVGHWPLRTDLRSHILVAVQGAVSRVTAGLIRKQVLLAGVGGR